jgi:hypothetical protein
VAAVNGAHETGRPETGDSIVFTYAGVVNPDLVLSGWDGSATNVTVRIEGNSNDDILTVRDSSDDSILVGLGLIQLKGDYADTLSFTSSQMTLSGSTVTIVLGTRVGHAKRDNSAKNLVWWTFQGTATESGLPDVDF